MQLLNRLLMIFTAIVLVIIAGCLCLKVIFSSSENLDNFLKSAQTYTGLTVVVQDQVIRSLKENQTPEPIQVATKTVLSPSFTQQLLQPSLDDFVRWLQASGSTSPISLRINLIEFKEEIAKQLGNNNSLAAASQLRFQTIATVPDSIVLVDTQPERADTLRFFELLKNIYITSQQTLSVSFVVLVGCIVLLFMLNVGSLGRIVRRLSWPFLLAGITIVLNGFLTPFITGQLLLKDSPANPQTAQNFLSAGAISAFSSQLMPYGIGLGVVGIVGIVVAKFLLRSAKRKKRHGK